MPARLPCGPWPCVGAVTSLAREPPPASSNSLVLQEPGAGQPASPESQRPRLESALTEVPLGLENEDLGGTGVQAVFKEVPWSLVEKERVRCVGLGTVFRGPLDKKATESANDAIPICPAAPARPASPSQEVCLVRREPVSRLEKRKGSHSPRAW